MGELSLGCRIEITIYKGRDCTFHGMSSDVITFTCVSG